MIRFKLAITIARAGKAFFVRIKVQDLRQIGAGAEQHVHKTTQDFFPLLWACQNPFLKMYFSLETILFRKAPAITVSAVYSVEAI